MQLKNKMHKDAFWVMTAQVISIAIAVVINVILTRYLSKSDFGYYQLALAYVSLASFLSLPGFNQTNIKGGAKSYDNIFFLTLKYRVIGSSVGIIVFLCVGSLFVLLWNKETLGYMMIIGSLFFPIYPLQQFDSLLIGKRRFDLSRGLAVGFQILRLLLIGISAIITKDLMFVFVMTIITQAIYAAIGFVITLKTIDRKERNPQFEKELRNLGIKMTLIGIWSTIAGRIERVILGMMDPKLLAIYHIGAIIPRRIRDNAKPILSVPTTHWLRLSREKNLAKVKCNWYKFVFFGSSLTILLWFASPYFIPILFGNQYVESVKVVQWFSLSISFIFLQTMILNVAVYQGEENFFMKLLIVQSILKIILFLILIPRFGISGAVASILSSEIMIFIISLLWFINKLRTREPNSQLKTK